MLKLVGWEGAVHRGPLLLYGVHLWQHGGMVSDFEKGRRRRGKPLDGHGWGASHYLNNILV